MALIARWPEPDRGPEAIAINVVESCEPENLVGGFGDGRADVGEPPLGVGDHQDPELRLAESLREFAGDGELEIVGGLLLPDRERFGAEIDFEEHRADAFAGAAISK